VLLLAVGLVSAEQHQVLGELLVLETLVAQKRLILLLVVVVETLLMEHLPQTVQQVAQVAQVQHHPSLVHRLLMVAVAVVVLLLLVV
jgi:hypothetical protein